ncbi:MAG: 2-amino-4-hydroxy-6-hydroxymethyldihydropteridine diphosphokinase [Alphaproteobacteria bacterium]|nr:MAG: 2-amino-4-hydroxy-6-hydroxymethyldihydropteridine diphosphokinase [Alphaproteobacteria bacterium]
MSTQVQHRILLAFGGNLPSVAGSPLDTQIAAITRLCAAGLTLEAVSAVYRTCPVPPTGQPDFINTAAAFRTGLAPADLLALCLRTETALGRVRGERWSARTLDVDLIAYDRLVLPDQKTWQSVLNHADPAHILPEAVVPHPRMHLRGFVLAPIADVAPDWIHPVLGKTVRAMLADEASIDGLAGVERIAATFGGFPALQGRDGAV